MKLKILLTSVLMFATANCFASATDATPLKVGPVSYYGALHTSGGKVIGAKNNEQAMLRGVSLYWSDATGQPYYNSDVIAWAKDSLKIDVFRFAMGIQYYNSKGNAVEPIDESYSYMGASAGFLLLIDEMVKAAVENDVYIILDWHSHRAEYETDSAKAFFSTVSQKYANIPNVIYEIYNEPVKAGWSAIQTYANAVIPAIRANTQNLVLVGTPNYSQMSAYGGLSYTNLAYVLHFYAGTHKVSTYGSKLTSAMNSGNAVFISEWGTTNANGDGSPDQSATAEWISFMESNRISNCNWSLRQYTSPQDNKSELSAIFEGSSPLTTQKDLSEASYTTSGTIVKNYLQGYASSWADSLTKGARSGSCAFAHQNTTILTSSLDVLNSSCSYTSSNTDVVAISGSTLLIKSAGFAIIEGNDGTKSVVSVSDVPAQSITNFNDLTCRYSNDSSGTCSKNQGKRYSSNTSGYFEWTLGLLTTTDQGSTFSLKSLNPEIVDTKFAACTSIYCSTGQKAASAVHMFEFKKFGTTKIVATAPAVTGYRELNDTITVTFAKKLNKITAKFKDTTLALNSTVENILPATAIYCDAPLTYTFDSEATSPYLTQFGTSVITGSQDAIVTVTATAAETDFCAAQSISKTFVIGDSSKVIYSGIELSTPRAPFQMQIQNENLLLQLSQSGNVHWSIYSITGQRISSKTQAFSAGSHLISFKDLPAGSYLLKVRQGQNQGSFRWNKR